jgi:hypothetical protein
MCDSSVKIEWPVACAAGFVQADQSIRASVAMLNTSR